VLSAVGVFGGLLVGFLAIRPRLLVAVLVLTPVLSAQRSVDRRSSCAPIRAIQTARAAALGPCGRVAWGTQYRLLDDRFYPDLTEVSDLRRGETLRFVVRAAVAYVAEPLPWKTQSRVALAYLPEQIVWYLIALLVPIGLPFRVSTRSDRDWAARRPRARDWRSRCTQRRERRYPRATPGPGAAVSRVAECGRARASSSLACSAAILARPPVPVTLEHGHRMRIT